MDDTNESAQNAQDGGDGDGGGASPDELQTQVETEEFQEIKDMEVDNEMEQNSEEESPSEHSPGSPELPADGLIDGNIPPPSGADVKELSVVIAEDEEPLKNGSTSPRADFHEEIEMEGQGEDEANSAFSDSETQPASEMEIPQLNGVYETDMKTISKSFLLDANDVTGDESGTEEEQAAFMKELETFHRERFLDFRPPRFYQEPLNLLKLWRACIRVGGYEQATSLKLWRQVGESFRPPKTCTTVSWTFRGFYEKTLLEYEKYKMRCGELPFADASYAESGSGNQADHAPSGRAIRNSAARAMQGWHSRLLGNGEVGDPIIKDKNPNTSSKREKQLKNIGFLKRKGSSPAENALKVACVASKPQEETMVLDVGVPADWVKVNVQRMKDCYEVYALVPGLLREEVRVQSDPAGRLVISGEPEELDNPWGVTPFKKVISLPTRIDPHQTSAVVTMQGQLFVRVPLEQTDM